MKRFLAFLLTLAMVLSLMPAAIAAEPREQEDDVWQEIYLLEDQISNFRRVRSAEERNVAFTQIVDQIAELVEESGRCVPGSLERHGYFLFWVDVNGDPNGYSPRLRAQIRQNEIPGADPEALAATEVVSYGTRGGWAGSVDVAAFQPYIGIDGSFTAQYENRCNAIAQATGGTGTTYKTNYANITNLGIALSNCGVVIFDSHGTTDYEGYDEDYTSRANSSYLCLTTGAGITDQDKQTHQGTYGSYSHAINLGGNQWGVDGTAIANHMTGEAPNSMVWMAICLGMATDGIEAPFRAHGAEVVYGYSQSVTFSGDYKFDGYFWPYMCQDHTVAEACAYMKEMAGCNWDPAYSGYSYSSAVANHVAFPIVASSEDPYPGQGNVDVIQVPVSTWTLKSQFVINAVSNNEAWGSVSVLGRKITASPATGYYVDGYEVLEGSATVTRSGNVFTVDPASDCTIQINFAPRDPAVVSFSVPKGVSCEAINAYVGDEITLPEPTGTPDFEGISYHFLGWSEAPLSADTLTEPEFLPVGTTVKLQSASVTYYALYSYFVAENGLTDDEFIRVDKAPEDWTGEYVISYNGQYALNATKDTIKANICSTKAVVDLAAAGSTYESNLLHSVQNSFTYVITATDNGSYTVKMKDYNHYLAMDNASNAMTTFTSSSTDKTRWTISMDEDGVVLHNAAYTDYKLQYNAADGVFCPSTDKKAALTLFAKADGDTWYTSQPKDKPVCTEHQYGDWTVTLEPTCTEAGSRYRLCTVCGTRMTEDIEALGHAYDAAVTAPTCLEGGYTTYTCSRCRDSYTGDETEALGHDYVAVVTAPTCLEGGYTTYTCSRCRDSYTGEETEALGHDWDQGVVTLQPTTQAEGIRTFTCKRCSATKTEPIDKLLYENPFEDVTEDDFFFTPVLWAVNHDPKITTGTDKTHFSPDKVVTRAEAMMFLYAAKGCPTYDASASNLKFSDVGKKHWARKAIEWAITNNITVGTGDGKFSPNKTCNRSEILTFLYATMGAPDITIDNPYSDVKNKHWYKNAAIWAYEKGIEKGAEGKFQASTPTSRAYIVTYLYRYETGAGLAE